MRRFTSVALCAALAGNAGLVFDSPTAMASGFALPELSVAGIGTTNALVANPNETGAFSYNPAAMSFHDASSVAVGGVFINPDFTVETATGTHGSEGADWVGAPVFQAAFKLSDRWRIGLGVNGPFGLETKWQVGTFPALTGSTLTPVRPGISVPIPNGSHPTQSKLEILDFVPTVAYKVSDNLSAAAGLDVYWAKSATLDSSLGQLDGDGSGVGFNASFLYRRDAWSVGASYHSAATVGIEGSYTPLSPTLLALGALKPGQPAKLDLNLPWRLQIGVRYAISKPLAVEFDWTRTGWSEFDQLQVRAERTGGLIFSDTNAWKDANAYRFALTYSLRPTTELRLGYTYDETGQGDSHFSARIPDSDRHLFGIGLAQDLGDGYALEVGYMYVKFKERNYSGTRPYRRLGDDINGSNAIAGKYQASANLVGLELGKTF
jgi:long-chain fatty acid transport protein